MGRISREVMFMQMARSASLRSTCFRLNVGAIVTRNNSPVAVGYNGQEPGAPHCAGNDCPGMVPGRCGTLHAEVNALVKAGTVLNGVTSRDRKVDLYCTDSPCGSCVDFIIEDSPLFVGRLFYERAYRDTTALQRLIEYQDPDWPNRPDIKRTTEVYLVTPAGYIVDHFTRRLVELP